MHLSWVYWDPNPVAFRIPIIDLPVFIYGLFFVSGFILGYFVLLPIFARQLQLSSKDQNQDFYKLSQKLADRLTWFIIGGTIIGARLGHVLFYDWERYKNNLIAILNTREGGLASHGGAIGVILALLLFHYFVLKKEANIPFIKLVDMIVIPTALVGCFIRIGNFFNQEIVGIPTQVSWAIVFGHPADGEPVVPRHPVQLYEAVSYLAIFFLLYFIWKVKKEITPAGLFSGLFFFLIFSARFIIEYWKAQQTAIVDQSYLQMGQLLSLPFIFLGLCLLCRCAYLEKTSHKIF
ncbi:hypothetical protein PHSC3_000329 [Chlamydiales bacterium STE3]|nr:hypothetical protein PHSC3_000329 [Chlamydiales bacterium STE3]